MPTDGRTYIERGARGAGCPAAATLRRGGGGGGERRRAARPLVEHGEDGDCVYADMHVRPMRHAAVGLLARYVSWGSHRGLPGSLPSAAGRRSARASRPGAAKGGGGGSMEAMDAGPVLGVGRREAV